MRSLSAGGPSLWPPTKTAPLDSLLDLQKGAQEQLERRLAESVWERLHCPSMDGLFFPLCVDQMVTCALACVVAAQRGHRNGLRETMGETCLCVERGCCNGAFGDLEATLGSSDHPVSPPL